LPVLGRVAIKWVGVALDGDVGVGGVDLADAAVDIGRRGPAVGVAVDEPRVRIVGLAARQVADRDGVWS